MDQFLTQWGEIQGRWPLVDYVFVRLLPAFGILLIGFWIARFMRKKVRGAAFGLDEIDTTLRPALAQLLYYGIIAVTFYAVLRQMDVDPTGLLAVFGAAGLAIGLALKDTLGNIAAGTMLLVLRPLNVGEYIVTPVASGTVSEIGLFATQITADDGLLVFVPNGLIWSGRIKNYNRHKTRKLVVDLIVDYDTNLQKAVGLIGTILNESAGVLQDPNPPKVLVSNFAPTGATLSASAWLLASGWDQAASNIRLNIKTALDEAGINLPSTTEIQLVENRA